MIISTLNEALHADILHATPIPGGDINDAYKLTLSDGTSVFMKANKAASTAFFQAEADGLEAIRGAGAIRVPGVIAVGHDDNIGSYLLLEWVESKRQERDFWEAFGHSLAAMHLVPTSGRFGWKTNNYIGARPQINTPHDNWVAFYRDCRLAPQFRDARHYFDADMKKRFARLLDRLDEYLLEPPHPSLLHGDLWAGNYITGPDGYAWLIDPAVYVGHREADLAMTELFGGFHPDFYGAYAEVFPMQPGYADRRDLYNLYHLLNHLNLFGAGYLGPVQRLVRRYAG